MAKVRVDVSAARVLERPRQAPETPDTPQRSRRQLVTGGLFFDLPLPLAVIGHEGGTVLVVLNGLRLLSDPIRRPKLRAEPTAAPVAQPLPAMATQSDGGDRACPERVREAG